MTKKKQKGRTEGGVSPHERRVFVFSPRLEGSPGPAMTPDPIGKISEAGVALRAKSAC